MTNKYVKNAREGAKGTDRARIHKSTQGRKVQEDGDKNKEKHGMKPQPRPTHKHAHTFSIEDGNEKLRKVWQVCCDKMKKQKQSHLPRPLYRESARQKGMLSKTVRKKKGGGNTRHNTQKKPTDPPKACTHSLATGGQKRGWTNREVCIYA